MNREFLYNHTWGTTNLPHATESQQWDHTTLLEFFALVDTMRHYDTEARTHSKPRTALQDRILVSLFYEPSTRTRLSFEAAMYRLGGHVLSTENAAEFSSAIKGERIEDTIRVIGHYGDIVIIRHKESGASDIAAHIDTIPVINAGDGIGQHPTQALIDVYTIYKLFGKIDGLEVALSGDLALGRAARSLAYMLAKFAIKKLYLVSHEVARMKDDVKEYLRRHSVEVVETDDLASVASRVHVIYQTRLQRERFGDRVQEFEQAAGKCTINQSIVKLMKSEARILHPLPRVDEITPDVDSTHHAAYFTQAANGIYVRMALLTLMLGKDLS